MENSAEMADWMWRLNESPSEKEGKFRRVGLWLDGL